MGRKCSYLASVVCSNLEQYRLKFIYLLRPGLETYLRSAQLLKRGGWIELPLVKKTLTSAQYLPPLPRFYSAKGAICEGETWPLPPHRPHD